MTATIKAGEPTEVAPLRQAPTVLGVLDYEIETIRAQIARQRIRIQRQDRVNGGHSDTADRILDWLQVRLDRLLAARILHDEIAAQRASLLLEVSYLVARRDALLAELEGMRA